MKQVKNFCVFAAALGMVFGGIGLVALCFHRPETAAVLGGVLLPCGAAAFLARRLLLRFAPWYIAGKRTDKCIKSGGLVWLIPYHGNENIWRETPETEEDGEENDNSGVLAKLEQREGLGRLSFSADRERLLAAGLENGSRIWISILIMGSFKGVWLEGVLELPKEGGHIRVAACRGRLSENPEKYVFETAGH